MANKSIKKILIATGIYPPSIGGPAQYAYELERLWKGQGYEVEVKYFGIENKLPTGIRHLYFLFKSLPAVIDADFILVLDTWSVALPISVASMVLGKKFVIRTGGDFLWESYVERTKQKVLLRDFYKEAKAFTFKENLIFKTTKWILNRASKIVFSTDWQRSIWISPYSIDISKTELVENCYGGKVISNEPKSKIFLGSTRDLVWKNLGVLKDVFQNIDATLDLDVSSHDDFIERIKESYAVILVSLGDISPNMILDAIACGKPFIVTREIGIYERIKDVAIFVDPMDKEDIRAKVLWLCDEENYKKQKALVESFSFTHSWQQIADELLQLDI